MASEISDSTTLVNKLNTFVNNALFLEAMREINWSRAYDWYCELDGVPSPFARNSVIGLPATNITFQLNNGESFGWNNGPIKLFVPQNGIELAKINIELIDDEQGTLRQFFERWFNYVYNPYYGVMPLEECCKCFTLYYQKATRTRMERVYYDIDGKMSKDSGINFLVYPTTGPNISLGTSESKLISFNVDLQCVDYTMDFGDPGKHSGGTSSSSGEGWLDKIFDYI